jgi:starch phosphorylase
MDNFQTYQVLPTFPDRLSFLEVLSRNLWWSWKPDALALLNRIDPELWEESGQNPIVFLTLISQERLDELASECNDEKAGNGSFLDIKENESSQVFFY